ncbi:MAG: RNA polymerase sigma factor [Verrucomicrobiota bacterium]
MRQDPIGKDSKTAASADFQNLVDLHYKGLFRFAMSLTQCEAQSGDLTQETYLEWAKNGHRLRDSTKAKSWLFSTLYRKFLNERRHKSKHRHIRIDFVETELPEVSPEAIRKLSYEEILSALNQLDELHRTPLTLFHLREFSYKEIAETLEVPVGTVMSRISRGRAQVVEILTEAQKEPVNTKTL